MSRELRSLIKLLKRGVDRMFPTHVVLSFASCPMARQMLYGARRLSPPSRLRRDYSKARFSSARVIKDESTRSLMMVATHSYFRRQRDRSRRSLLAAARFMQPQVIRASFSILAQRL